MVRSNQLTGALSNTPAFGVDRSASTKRNVEGLQFFYNIATPVGLDQPNHKLSVMLVQYMLGLYAGRLRGRKGVPAVPVTGVVDAATDRLIRDFQEWLAWSPHAGAVPVDGVLAPVAGESVAGPGGNYVPPVLLLNRMWWSIEPQTFTDPRLLAGVLGEEAVAALWQAHPLRDEFHAATIGGGFSA